MYRFELLTKPGVVIGTLLMAVGFVGGCATPPTPGSPAAVYEEEQKNEDARAKAVEETVAELPDWYTNLPEEPNSTFSVGTAVSLDLQMAMDKATLSAKADLADRINSLISGKVNTFKAESGTGEDAVVVMELDQVVKNVFIEVDVSGYTPIKSKVLPQGNKYRAYVLLQYPIGEANRILVDQIKRNRSVENKLRASKAYRDLEEEIKKKRALQTQ